MSYASFLMTSMTTWRNPYGNENRWLANEAKYRSLPSVRKIVTAEAGFAGIAVVAAVETAVSASLAACAKIAHASVEEERAALNWLKSSSFSFVWAIANLNYNLRAPNLFTREDLAIEFAKHGCVHMSRPHRLG